MKKTLILTALLLATFFYGYYYKKNIDTFLGSANNDILKTLPNVTLPVFLKEESKNFQDFASKHDFTLVHFWATWCGPCEKEFPDLIRLIKRLEGKKIGIILVAVDDDKMKMQKFLKKFEKITSNYTLLVDNQSFHRSYFGISKLPESFVFDQNYRIKRSLIGPQEWLSSPIISYFDSLIKQ